MCNGHPPRKRNWRLYYLLDLTSPTTSRQVKWNFRKITLRHHYYQAYLVLYNRSRKYLYDSIGENAYGFLASGTWGPFVPLLGAVGSVIVYSLVLLIEVALLLLFFAFLAANDGHYMSLSFEMIILPLMIFAAIMLMVAVAAVVINIFTPRTYQEGMSLIDRLSPVGNSLAALSYFCIPFVLYTQIRSDPASKVGLYLWYMFMPIVGDILYYTTSLIWRWPRRVRLQMEVGNNRPSPIIYNGIFAMGFLNMACGVAQWVLIGYKLDGRLNRSWYIIFIPFCFRAGLRVAEACLRSMMKYTIGVRSEIGVAFDTVGSFFSNGMLLVSLYFVAVRINRGRERVRLAYALIPVYLTLIWILLCLMVTVVLLLIFYRRRSREERRVNRHWTPPQDKYEETAKTLGSTDTSDSGPVRVLKASEHGWDDVDSISTTFATFPADVDDHGGNEEYEDFETDEEQPVPPKKTSRRLQVPYSSPRDDVSEAADADRTPISNQNSSKRYTVPRHANRTAGSVYEARAGTSRSASQRGVSGLSSRRGSPERYTPEVASGVTTSATSGEDDYTEVTTYMNEETAMSRTGEDFTRTSSYSYTAQTTYVEGDTDQSQTTSYTRSNSYSSISSAASIGNVAASATRGAERKR
ncbi:conserved hypothetical protein [Leishmania mexicana MHOM/GT/2001/U1103]|uniref:Transmembrane protein n=1 Tax=Leishmania mexicana (strain MHOM/GT/2001/U1103) TaxID=929439 RepID=E9AU32_LEIMU|nr:conserved hypothetical protein [Leishmania mexicana MHOM/GT/2001/U1103]CBZ26457.1 conserved hypothetical protein [Leishmania mexicana MHOM/GT/2001/U1103]